MFKGMPGKLFATLLFLFFSLTGFAQRAVVTGKVITDNIPLAGASVGIQGSNTGAQTNNEGEFRILVPTGINVVLLIKYIGYQSQQIPILLQAGQTKTLLVYLLPDTGALQAVEVRSQNPNNTRDEVSITRLNPRLSKDIPTVFGEFNKILATLPGVTSNNELSSAYTVRGGNYDENLVYVNGIEIYRPFLISNAQQEGLSFINPDLVGNIEFSAGGWQPKFGDKLSSVLNIEYKTPQKFAASVTGSLLGGGMHVEGVSSNNRLRYLVGGRYKNAQLLFNRALETSGNYQPKFGDFQTYLNLDLSQGTERGKTTVGILGSAALNRYLVIPSARETTFGSINKFVRLVVGYEGRERMDFNNYQGGVNLRHQFSRDYYTEFILSSFASNEREFRNIEAGYSFCDIDLTPGSRDFNKCVAQREVGTNFDYSRNTLRARVSAMESRHYLNFSEKSRLAWGAKWTHESVADRLDEYSFTDSADFIKINTLLNTDLNLVSDRVSGFLQHTYQLSENQTLTYGARANHWGYTGETTFSPRVQYAISPVNAPQVSYKAAIGYYYQAPFYRELRNQQGNLNQQLKSQRSLHFIVGNEYAFKKWSRDFKLVTEAYYKKLDHVIPYDVDNMRLRYFALNNAKAYAVGFDTRINGEFIKGAESWFSLGVLSTKEDITGDTKSIYEEGSSRVIGTEPVGFIRRPTDQRVNVGVFFQDHMPNDPSLKMYLNMLFGTGLPFNPPGMQSLRNKFTMPAYKRVDIGFSKLISLQDGASKKNLESLWVSLEVLNLIAANNVVSYNYVKDINEVTYAVPNYLSSRLLNLRFIARF